jgi:hypothetical protein
MNQAKDASELIGYQGPHFLDHGPADGPADSSQPLAWEEVSAGRYLPRRVRGSYLGRALG